MGIVAKLDLDDFEDHPLGPRNYREHRYLWFKEMAKEANERAWSFWLLKVLPTIVTVTIGAISVWGLSVHGAGK